MSQIRAIDVNDVQYNVAQASAVDQKKLMLLIGSKVALHSAAGGIDKINTSLLFGLLTSLPENVFDDIAKMMLRQAFVAGQTTAVTVADFQGGVTSYFKLIAEAIAFNLEDYFIWLDSENAARRAQANGKA
jgi:F420-0:gamma-glutamyl ligase